MIDAVTDTPARVFTAFATVLYVDPVSRELRHGPVDSSPANAFFVLDRNLMGAYPRGRLTYDAAHGREPIRCEADRGYSPAKADCDGVKETVFELIALERGLIAFRSGDLFLSAVPDGRITLAAPACRTWELFLASESWCGLAVEGGPQGWNKQEQFFNRRDIKSYIVHPLIRVATNLTPKAKKVLVYGYTKWSHGRVYYDLCRYLHEYGYIVDILDWQVNHRDYFQEFGPYYDVFMTALDGVHLLVDEYCVPYEKIIAVSHSEFDIRMLIEKKGIEVFERFASYGVVSEFLYCASLTRGVKRVPMVASIAVDYSEFHSDVSERLATVGYASSLAVETFGVEWKRGALAEAAAKAAGLPFKVAGWTGEQTLFHDMPDFYRGVDAVLVSSITEAGQLPVIEAAAAGRLVIGTPVGHFPRKAYEGGGILAPIEREKFIAFAAATLSYYKENPREYRVKCLAIQEAARNFDWQYSIQEWIDLIEAGAARLEGEATESPSSKVNGLRPEPQISMHPLKSSDLRHGSAGLSRLQLAGHPHERTKMKIASNDFSVATQSKIRRLLEFLRPEQVREFQKIRVGSPGDGGYIQLDDHSRISLALSFGINDDDNWDIAMAERGVYVKQYDHTIDEAPSKHHLLEFHKKMVSSVKTPASVTLQELVSEHPSEPDNLPNVILKMDIEGSEWDVFDRTDGEALTRIAQIVCEFHGFSRLSEPDFFDMTLRVFQKLNTHFAVFHVHANNWAPLTNIANLPVPDVLEVSFANRRVYSFLSSEEIFPTALDVPNNPHIADIYLGSFRF